MATFRSIATASYQDLGIVGAGAPLSAYQAQYALTRANRMLQGWSLQNLTIPVLAREVFTMTIGKGSPTNPYTIGSGGDLDTTRPLQITGCGALQLSGLTTEVEIPRGVLTTDAYEAIQVKRLTNSLFTNLYYQPTSPLGKVYLWPVPDGTAYDLVLYFLKPLSEFADLDTDVDLPPGAEDAIQFGLSERLMLGFKVPAEIRQEVRGQSNAALAIYKRGNMKMEDLGQDPAVTGNRRGGYNINTGTGG